jgi:opacity protein-like surface antigen
MFTFSRLFLLGGVLASLPLRAVYAPIPEQEQGKNLTFAFKLGAAHDTNLFAAASRPVGSWIWTAAPRVTYNGSLTDQTFLSAGYGLTLDRFDNRPGDKLLDSHDATVRVAHAFTKSTTIDLTESINVARNPEALLSGVPLNPDQSYTRNQLDGRFNTPLGPKAELLVKARSVYYRYRDAALGRSLDRFENLYGASADYAVLPETKVVGEYRRLEVFYDKLGETKNKRSNYLMGGVDYAVARKLSLSTRVGAEWRKRVGERSATSPYAEASAKFDYTKESFVVAGAGYAFEETSDTARFNDTKVRRAFASVQHHLTALIVASGSVNYEPATLQGRRGVASVAEKTLRVGGALSYLPTKNWVISASYDYDRVSSLDAQRKLRRERGGISGTYSF